MEKVERNLNKFEDGNRVHADSYVTLCSNVEHGHSYGSFLNDGNEYVVKEVDTTLPLVNYFWNDSFISGVSQHMAGIGCFTERPMQYMHPECRSLLIRNENRHFYIRDDEAGNIWSPGWYPVLEPLDDFRCRHGMGYSVLHSERAQIRTEMTVFVPRQEPVEIWKIAITNTGKSKRRIKVYSFADLLLTGYEEYCDYHSSLRAAYDERNNLLMCFNETSERPHSFFNCYMASDAVPSGFDSSRKAFLGYNQVNSPDAVIEGHCRNSLGSCEKLVAVLEHTFELETGVKAEYHVIIGTADSISTAAGICRKLFAAGSIDTELIAVKESISKSYSSITIKTPEEKINGLFNYWIKRSIALHTEVGTDTGRGFRDVMQAAWAVSSFDPEGAKQKIIDCLRHQYADGHTLRGWNPIDTHHYSDGPVWIAPAVESYLKETGDVDFLNERVPYFDEGSDTVWGHTLKGIMHATEDLGPNGLIRIHYGDWNDSLNMLGEKGIGESVWTSIGMVFCIKSAMKIAREVLRDEDTVRELLERMSRLKDTINDKGWDGKWYLEAYNDSGARIGSHTEKEGRCYLNPQTWAVMAGIADEDRIPMLLEAIDNELDSEYGSLVLTPAYTQPNPEIGRLTWFTPGMWENASSYCHGTAFKIMADTYLGRGNRAYDSMMKILPDSEKNPSSQSGCPPYMVTNMYYGPEHPRKGQILYSWITGTSDWLFKSLCGHIIGVRADFSGLTIDPCVPSHWEQFGICRKFRGAVYDVEFFNPSGKETGVTCIEVDGIKIDGVCLPDFRDGKTHSVKVTM